MIARRRILMLAAYAVACAGSVAQADSLYPAGPGTTPVTRPLLLVNDRRANQVGDLVAVQFDFSVASTSSLSNAQKKDYNLALNGATGAAAFLLLRNPAGASGASSSDSSKTKSDASSFATTMTATVVSIMPSGALNIVGQQNVFVDGQDRVLHVTGSVRPGRYRRHRHRALEPDRKRQTPISTATTSPNITD